MEAHHIAGLEEFLLRGDGLHALGLDGLGGAVGIVGIDIHAESLGYTGHVAAHIAEGEQTESLAHELAARLAVVEVAHGIDQQSHH